MVHKADELVEEEMKYTKCKWCYGEGCNQCEVERQKDIAEYEKNGPQPIFTAKTDSPEDMKLLKDVFGKDALEHAFGPEGEGMHEIELNAAGASLLQILRESNKSKEKE